MQRFGTLLLCAGTGAASGAFLSFATFVVLSLFDSTGMESAIGYGILVGLAGGFVGLCIGTVVGAARLGMIGGGIVGGAATLLLVLLYVVTISSPGKYGYFLRESAIIIVVFAFPTIATGIVSGLMNRILLKA